MAPNKDKKLYKRYLKTLQSAKGYPKLIKELIRQAPIPVLKLLSNAAIVAARGNIRLNPRQKKLFRQNLNLFKILANRRIGFENKRRYLVQSGNGIPGFIPILLGTVIPLVGQLLSTVLQSK